MDVLLLGLLGLLGAGMLAAQNKKEPSPDISVVSFPLASQELWQQARFWRVTGQNPIVIAKEGGEVEYYRSLQEVANSLATVNNCVWVPSNGDFTKMKIREGVKKPSDVGGDWVALVQPPNQRNLTMGGADIGFPWPQTQQPLPQPQQPLPQPQQPLPQPQQPLPQPQQPPLQTTKKPYGYNPSMGEWAKDGYDDNDVDSTLNQTQKAAVFAALANEWNPTNLESYAWFLDAQGQTKSALLCRKKAQWIRENVEGMALPQAPWPQHPLPQPQPQQPLPQPQPQQPLPQPQQPLPQPQPQQPLPQPQPQPQQPLPQPQQLPPDLIIQIDEASKKLGGVWTILEMCAVYPQYEGALKLASLEAYQKQRGVSIGKGGTPFLIRQGHIPFNVAMHYGGSVSDIKGMGPNFANWQVGKIVLLPLSWDAESKMLAPVLGGGLKKTPIAPQSVVDWGKKVIENAAQKAQKVSNTGNPIVDLASYVNQTKEFLKGSVT